MLEWFKRVLGLEREEEVGVGRGAGTVRLRVIGRPEWVWAFIRNLDVEGHVFKIIKVSKPYPCRKWYGRPKPMSECIRVYVTLELWKRGE